MSRLPHAYLTLPRADLALGDLLPIPRCPTAFAPFAPISLL